ncbi:hypothetical protein EDB92DRAFT_2101791 [Lactarius akahatsu]|uniref:Uncharacterized protein n=1 Tax=Lactarius akahatsu TaxID=416441 RepID=A0AAD4LM52_9AGAM|nr:hypothetical protein EDB92DRAFT_2101791 [Lactarius akahatsu]
MSPTTSKAPGFISPTLGLRWECHISGAWPSVVCIPDVLIIPQATSRLGDSHALPSTRWGFSSLRKHTLKSITPPTPHDQFVPSRTYSVDHWVLPVLTALCERSWPLCLDEARQMSTEDVVLVAMVREEICGGWKPSHPVGDDIIGMGQRQKPLRKNRIQWSPQQSIRMWKRSASAVSSSLILVWQECKPINDKLDADSILGKAGDTVEKVIRPRRFSPLGLQPMYLMR